MNYDNKSPEAILEKANELTNKCLRDLYPEYEIKGRGKGSLGTLIESLHFGYAPNSTKGPDFIEAGVELKTAGIVQKTNNKYIAKERLSLGNINFSTITQESFENSSLLEKSQLLLLMFYLYEKGLLDIDKVFKIIKLWKLPVQDIQIIKQDWNTIVDKIKNGEAHTISGSDTYYLEASTTGLGKGRDLVNQPYSTEKAKRRRFAFKNKYVNIMIADELDSLESILPTDFDFETDTISDYVQETFKKYYGQTENELIHKFGLTYSQRSKHKMYLLSKAILGLELDNNTKIEEFEKAGIKIKTVTLKENGTLKESMSFNQIKYDTLVDEDTFEESYFYNEIVSIKYLFVIFQKNKKGEKVLKRAIFWNMNSEVEKIAQRYWENVKKNVKERTFNNFWKSKDKKVFHVRPKAKNAKDTFILKDGYEAKKLAYWLNRRYILEEIINK